MTPKKVKKRASKVAHNRPRPFYFTVQPRPQPTAQNWVFILWNFGTRHLFSYLCLTSSNAETASGSKNNFSFDQSEKKILDIFELPEKTRSKGSLRMRKVRKIRNSHQRWVNFETSFWFLQFPSKNERKQVDLRYHGSKVEFVCSFFGGKSFWLCLTFSNNRTEEWKIDLHTANDKFDHCLSGQNGIW